MVCILKCHRYTHNMACRDMEISLRLHRRIQSCMYIPINDGKYRDIDIKSYTTIESHCVCNMNRQSVCVVMPK